MRIAVIGVGYWGTKVAREYYTLLEEGVIDDLILYDVDTEKLNSLHKSEFKDCKITTNIDDILNVDGVHICTPNSTHYELTMKFLKKDVNVLVEKPMTTNYREARKLAYYAYNKGLVLAVGHIFRFNNAVKKVKELYEKNFFGEPYFARLKWTHLMPPPKDRDIVYDLAPHPFDIINYIFSTWPTAVYAMGRAFRRKELEEVAYINAEFNNDFIAHIEINWMFPKKVRNVSIMFNKKFLSLDAVLQKIKIYELDDENWKEINIDPNNTIMDEILHFIDAIKNEDTPINDGFNASENVKVLDACIKSMREKKRVELVW